MPASTSSKVKSAEYWRTVGDAVYEAMVEVLKAPKDDRFQVIDEHPADALITDGHYLVIRRTQGCIFIQLTLNAGRTIEQKKDFYKAVADALHARLALRPEDVFINLIEMQKENWSFGNGIAQYGRSRKIGGARDLACSAEVDRLQCDLNH
ncbi:MAG: tautomerase family protein [Methylocella sp.]